MGRARRIVTGAPGLAAAFLLVHAWLFVVDVDDRPLRAAGDVTIVYLAWVERFEHGGPLVGLTAPSVYPVVALVPILLAAVAGLGHYLTAWMLLAIAGNAVATALLARRRIALAWWFVAFEVLLGPVAPARIDAFALVVAIAGVLAVDRRPALASVLLTVAAWIKVWPALVLLGIVTAGRGTVRVVVAAAVASVGIVAVALAAGGSLRTLFSFIGAQTSRGLQIEAPVTAPWLWPVEARARGAHIVFDAKLVTFEVTGIGVHRVATVMTWVLVAGVLSVLVLGILARRRGAPREELAALVALGLVAAVIALNKVGSPQYGTWYAAPVLLGLLAAPRRFRFPAVLVLVLAALTQLIYPWNYRQVLDAHAGMLVVLDVRDLLEVVLLGWTMGRIATLRRPTGHAAVHAGPVGPGIAVA